jgi:hypothetical protein
LVRVRLIFLDDEEAKEDGAEVVEEAELGLGEGVPGEDTAQKEEGPEAEAGKEGGEDVVEGETGGDQVEEEKAE